jgi:hypothetical protein
MLVALLALLYFIISYQTITTIVRYINLGDLIYYVPTILNYIYVYLSIADIPIIGIIRL